MLNRRRFIQATGLAGMLVSRGLSADQPITRPIPKSGEALPVIGMGTSRTFNVGGSEADRAPLRAVLDHFFAAGGTLIDSSPMYGNAEAVTGDLLRGTENTAKVFAATKVWTNGREQGIEQMRRSMVLMGVETMDLMQVHNLRDTKTHLKTLREWKEQGKIRYIGITTSRRSQFDDFQAVMRAEPLDFVQLNYSVGEREAEDVLLPLAEDKGIATLINRPYMRGALFRRVQGKPLPDWAADIDCSSWAQLFLKFILGHPAATCVIPATSKPKNMIDNMGAGFGALPDRELRQRIVDAVAA